MADKDQSNDEYEFADTDILDTRSIDDDSSTTGFGSKVAARGVNETNVRRNALIAVVVFVASMVIYKFMHAYFTEKKSIDNQEKIVIPKPNRALNIPVVTSSVPKIADSKPQVSFESAEKPESYNKDLNQKVAGLLITQENTRADVSSLSSQIVGLTNNIQAMSESIAVLNTNLSSISSRLESQSNEISNLSSQLMKAKKPAEKQYVDTKKPIKYYIQALIPGRAWLVSSTGETITVREGSTIRNYGTVKLIDAMQGRITTSSGMLIRFSPDGS